ncbi:glucosamine-6-phosphate deaminase [Halobacillus litoralis]|uniref:glucosamine-6-phosphate deaminase n=1 Tax=Halobacillus litoralis TaxID=45668 RepID=UPI001CD2757C|nr:glucosamine-6-phosphate deaminase [Halobacillus litoralis]MCA0970911.1 glucosamine-6-phosphate deaminase [Halobacillus litoralis]
MNIIVTETKEQLSEQACSIFEAQVKADPESVLGLATGSTPLGTYEKLIEGYKKGNADYQRVKTLNLDEYVGLGPDHPESYRTFMEENLFGHLNIDAANTYIPDGTADDLEKECLRYEEVIEKVGPPDIQLLGIGENGHIGFNEPGSSFDTPTHIVELAASTREANARFFPSIEDVPKQAVTMGIRSILKSKRIVLIASGERKARAIERLLAGEIDEAFPASALKNHDDVTLIVDRNAYQFVDGKG